MNGFNLKIIGIVVVLGILLGAGGLIFLANNKSAKEGASVSTSPTPENQQNTPQGSLLDIFNLGKTQKCTFSYKSDTSSTEGTVYVTQNKLRGDFKVTSAKKTSSMYMLRNGETNYIWGDDLPTGIKMTLKLEDLAGNTQAQGYVDVNQKVDYKCTPWVIDNALFTPPSNIKFTDLSGYQIPTQKASPSGGSGQNQCSSCNSLSGSAKTYCLQQLNCL